MTDTQLKEKLKVALIEAIASVGLPAFKKTSFFGSNDKAVSEIGGYNEIESKN